jgi:high affinity sulfate transporter 1
VRFVPVVRVIRKYERRWLAKDLIAGLVLTAFLVPVGMGYAQAAGLPPITGLYATILPMLAYAVFGPSRVMVLGPDSSLAAVILAVVAPLAMGDTSRAVALASMLAILTGIVIAGAGFLRLGFVTELLSRPVQLGYLAGVAVLIVVGQAPKLLGISLSSEGTVEQTIELYRRLREVNPFSIAIGVGAIGIIALQRRFAPRLPGALLAVATGVAAVELLGLAQQGVKVLGPLPPGFPAFSVPRVGLSDISPLITGALGIALIATADTTVLSQSLAAERDEEIDPNEELVALGVANVASGLFAGFPLCASSSRTPVATSAGAETQLAGVVGALAIVVLLVLAPNLLHSLPQPVLSGIVLVAAYGLVDAKVLFALHKASRTEFGLLAVTFVGVTSLGVLTGIFVAIVLSLGDFVRRAWRPHDAVMGYVEELRSFHDVTRYPKAQVLPGLVIYRFDAPLFFANARHFRMRVRTLAFSTRASLRWLVVASEPITDVDTTAAEVIASLTEELADKGITLVFAELKDPVRDRMEKHGLTETVGEHRFFPSVESAVSAYMRLSDPGPPPSDAEPGAEAEAGA